MRRPTPPGEVREPPGLQLTRPHWVREPHRPDVYFTPEYGAAACTEEGSTWLGLDRCDGLFQLPLVLCPAPGGRADGMSPYGYSGVYAHPDLAPADLAAAWRSVRKELLERGVVSVFLRHSPLVPQSDPPFAHHQIVQDHPTVAVDLGDAPAAWAALSGKCRTHIRKALARGATTEVRPARPSDLVAGSDFRRLYEGTMDRHGAASFYYFSDTYYRRLLDGLGDRLVLATGRDADGEVQTAALFLHHGPFVHYHLSGSTRAGSRDGLNNLLLWNVVEHSAGLGASRLHLGGGTRPGDDLERFKGSFGPTRLSYRASGWVVDPAAYRELVAGVPDDLLSGDFFPPYRPR